MSPSTADRDLPLSSLKKHTTFPEFSFTHFARLCFFNSAAIDIVSPMHDAA